MATGERFRSLAFQFRISHSWISKIVQETLQSISKRMLNIALPPPDKDVLKLASSGFWNRWNYPNCCGAVDGKHIRIKCPINSGSEFYNYKDYFSMVLFALVDDKYRFLAIDVGSYGREGDASIFPKSNFGKSIANGTFPFPDPAPFPGTVTEMPHVIIGDDAFKLTETFMRPYPKDQSKVDESKAIYNYRHSRARRVTENAFGILCQYFRVFFTPIAISPVTTDHLIFSACILHNLMRSANIPCPNEEMDELPLPKENLIPLNVPTTGRNSVRFAYTLRDNFKDFFCSAAGSVDWQLHHVRKTV